MKKSLIFLALFALPAAWSQTVLTAPQVAGCPAPVPNPVTHAGWPSSTCKYQFYPLTDTTHAIASVSKTTPAYQHTYGGYPATAMLVACPKGAALSSDRVTCADASGADASLLTAKSAVPALAIGGPIVPTVATVTLSWTPPTKNSDGTTLTDLAGYNIYQGATAETLVKTYTVPVSASSYTTLTLPPGTYYFAMTAFNAANSESTRTPSVSTRLAPPPSKPSVPGRPDNVKITVTVTAG
jgi:hypothetical protein